MFWCGEQSTQMPDVHSSALPRCCELRSGRCRAASSNVFYLPISSRLRRCWLLTWVMLPHIACCREPLYGKFCGAVCSACAGLYPLVDTYLVLRGDSCTFIVLWCHLSAACSAIFCSLLRLIDYLSVHIWNGALPFVLCCALWAGGGVLLHWGERRKVHATHLHLPLCHFVRVVDTCAFVLEWYHITCGDRGTHCRACGTPR